MIVSLHDLHLTAQFADEVLLMHLGKLVRKGTPDQVFTRSLMKDVFSLMGELVREDGKPVLKIDNTPMLYQPV